MPPSALKTPADQKELLTERDGAVLVLTLNRPEALNALSTPLVAALIAELERGDRDPAVRAFVLTGGPKVFAAGADIKEMADASMREMFDTDRLAQWERLRKIRKPIVAAVTGYALGGGLELAMSCDLLIAADDAEFGQPEIRIGVMPGAGGTQRLTRAIGKYRAMEYVLTGRRFTARQAHEWGLVTRLAPRELVLEEALRLAREIAVQAPLAVRLAKEAVNKAQDVDLETGLAFERKLFYMLFGTEDQKEGMKAFLGKRKPDFQGK